MVLTREELDAAVCTDPECANPMCGGDGATLLIVSSCNTSAHAVIYNKRTGRLTLRCTGCNGQIAEIAVARSELVQ